MTYTWSGPAWMTNGWYPGDGDTYLRSALSLVTKAWSPSGWTPPTSPGIGPEVG